ncbi:MAG: sensor histidine kinase [Actinomycetota bacterium]
MAETVSSMDAPIRGGRFRDLPLFWKVLIPFFALMLVLGVLGAFLIVRDLSTSAKAKLDQDLIGRSLDVEAFIHERELYLLESANFAANLQDMPQAITRGDNDTVARLLQSVLALKTDLNLLVATDADGRPVAEFVRDRSHGRPRRVEGTVRDPASFLSTALRDQTGMKSSGFVDVAGDTMVAIVAPVCSAATPCPPVGVTIVGIKASIIINDALTGLESSGESAFGLALFDAEGRRVASRGLVPDEVSLPAIARDRPVARVTTTKGRDIETLYAPFEVQGERFGTIAVATETSPAFASARGTGIRLGLILLAAMTGIVAIGALLSRAILRQLRPLVATNRALGSGDLTARAEVLGNDELGELARGVNLMADQLQANIETLESRVDQRTQEVRRLLRERTEFFAGLSHELRTPLAIILNQSLMLRDPTFRKTRTALEGLGLTIGDSAEQLLSLVNEILELARSELGGIELEIEDVNLGEALRHFGGTVEGLASSAGLELRIDPPQRLPTVRADPERLRQILLNLVDNAVKYTPAGGTIEVGAKASNGRGVTVAISDSGVGIPADVGERIFDPFFRVPGTKSQRGQASSGLGLALTKRLVEAHGGEIWFTSEPDVGTTFNVTFPASRKAPRKKASRA